MKLADLKAAATAKLATVHADVSSYVSALDTSVKANKFWIAGGSAMGFILGYLVGHYIR